jgi:LysM repeat protein
MDNKDSTKPQETGGLKLMTVFIAVLALHVLVIGGFTVYHLMGSGGSDADLTLDKNQKPKAEATASADTTTDVTNPSTPAPTAAAGTTTASAPEATATPATTAAAPTSTEPASVAPATAGITPPVTPTPVPSTPGMTGTVAAPLVVSDDQMTPNPAIAPGLLPPPEPAPGVTIGAPVSDHASAPAAAPRMTATTPAPAAAPAPAVESMTPAPMETPAPTPALSTPATSGPIMPDDSVASGPVHLPATRPGPAATEEHTAAMHEMKKEYYTVKITDSYKKIAHAHHITVAQLKEANHITDNVLHAGQKLIIPMEKTSLARAEGTPEIGTPTRMVLSDTSSTASLSASPASAAQGHRHHYYTVTKGDTLGYIARKFNVSITAIKEANDLTGWKLAVGRKLRIPSREARSANTAVPSPAQPSQVETQPAPVAPMAQPAPVEQPVSQPEPATNPELANMTF